MHIFALQTVDRCDSILSKKMSDVGEEENE